MKRILSLILSVIMMISALSISVSAADVIRYGDVNDDGVIDTIDLLKLRQKVAKIIGNNDINRNNADINADTFINTMDINYLRQHLIKKKLIAASNVFPISAFSECMNLYGRAQWSEDGESVMLSQTASGIEFTANCAGNLEIYVSSEVELSNTNALKLNVTIDKDYENSYEVDVLKTKLVVETNLEQGEHTFLIQKATEHGCFDMVEITGISIGGEPGTAKPVQSDKRIEFYGDSLTAGYGNLTSNGTSGAGTWQYQNGCKTYATFTAQKLGADYAIAAASGHGVMYGYAQKVGTQTPDKYWDYTLVGEKKTPWSRETYDADLIVINFGTNDNSTDNYDWKDGYDVVIDKDEYKAKVKTLVETMKAENPDVEILWVLGMAPIPENSTVVKAIKEVDAELDYLNFYYAPAHVSGGDGHPTVEEHKTHATNLTNKILELYPDMF
ncbi:MAG: hypothetical protein IJD90_05250 [Clostridia bacterium]|nr:hypothetical protein [Clostridia bacterium]